MKTQRTQLLHLCLVGGFLITGCTSSDRTWVRQPPTTAHPAGEIMLTDKPPQPRREIVGTPPDDAHVWVTGYWMHSNEKWVWVPAHWEARPRPGAS